MLVVLIMVNVINLLMTVSEMIPDKVSAWFPLIFFAGAFFYLIGVGFHFIEKHSRL